MYGRAYSTIVCLVKADALGKKVSEVDLSGMNPSARRALLAHEGETELGQLLMKTEAEILRIPGFGRKSLFELQEALERIGSTSTDSC